MKKFLLAVVAVMLSFATAHASTMYAYQAWQPGTASPVRGPICFDTAYPSNAHLIADCSNMGVIYGGFYLDYHWIGQVIKQGTQSSVEGLYDINMATGERTLICEGGTKMIDMTYNYANKRVYGIRNGNTDLERLDPATGQSLPVGTFSIAYGGGFNPIYMLAIACDLEGNLYGVASNDVFYRINPADASMVYIGELGVDAGFDQSMAFDYNDGTLYWYNNSDYTLYIIDVETGRANPVSSAVGYQGSASLGSMFIPYINVAEGAPDRVTDISTSSTDNSITLHWTNPTKTAQGESLGSLTHVIIERDGQEVARVTTGIAPGAQSSYTDMTVESKKIHSYRIVPCNEAGRGGTDLYATDAQAGKQLPGAPKNLQARQGDGSAILTWELPEAGIHGGLYDSADITGYDIYRNSVKVGSTKALEYEDKTSFGTYTYKVVTMTADGAGGDATVERVMVKPASWLIMCDGSDVIRDGVKYKFYDNGGPNANYSNSQNCFLSLSPENPDSYICVDFTSFSTESPYDYLCVHNGNDYYPPMIGKFTGSSVSSFMRHIESTAADGGLLFYFFSDTMGNMEGWEATVYTAPRHSFDLEVTSMKVPAVITAESQATASVTVRNKGKNVAENFVIQLIANETVVAKLDCDKQYEGTDYTYTLSYTINTPGEIELVAKVVFEADGDASNNSSESVRQTVLEAGTVFVDVAHDNPAELYVVPASFMARESICQSIIDGNLLTDGKDMQLTAISFGLHTVKTDYDKVPFRIWAGETSLNDLENGIVPASQLTEVFHGTVNIAQGNDEVTFEFDKPLAYSGDNLVYTIHKELSTASNSGVTFKGCYGYEGTHSKVTRFDSRWSDDDDKVLDPNTTFGYSAQDHRADVKLIFSRDKGGVDNICVDDETLVYATASGVYVTAGARVYNMSGQLVGSASTPGVINLPKGVYLVKTADKTHKIIVR